MPSTLQNSIARTAFTLSVIAPGLLPGELFFRRILAGYLEVEPAILEFQYGGAGNLNWGPVGTKRGCVLPGA